MNYQAFHRLCDRLISLARGSHVPYDTGNLANNAFQNEYETPNVCAIYVDEDIAPYMPFTNEKWISPKWKGKKNPNEGWWDKLFNRFCLEIEIECGVVKDKYPQMTVGNFNKEIY